MIEIWKFSSIYDDVLLHSRCARTQTAITELLLKILTPAFDSLTLVSEILAI